MVVILSKAAVNDTRTYLANIEEPSTKEEWDAFDEKNFHEVAFPIIFNDKSHFIDKDKCERLLNFIYNNLGAKAKVGDVYDFLDKLDEELDDHMDYLERKEKATALEKDELFELTFGVKYLEV